MGHSIGIAVLLLSLTAGTFLLAKTKKEDLGTFYRVISWFVIVFSVLLIACSVIRCIVGRQHRMNHNQGEMMRHRMMSEGMGMREHMMQGSENEHSFMGKRHHRGEGKDREDGEEKQDTLRK